MPSTARLFPACHTLRACLLFLAFAASPTLAESAPSSLSTDSQRANQLPEAPQPTLLVSLATQPLTVPASATSATSKEAPAPTLTPEQRDAACQSGALRGKPCRVSWLPILWEAFEATAFENLGNIALDSETRHDLATHPYWSTYIQCVENFRYRQWRDDDGFVVDYVGHGMQGAAIASSFEQHDPKGRGLIYVNNGNYWRSRLKAMAWMTVYEVQWKVGPASEASIGNSGLNTYFTPRVHGRSTNETGFQDFVDTPIVGFWWNVGEDAMDRFVMPRIWSRTHNRLLLSAAFVLTPCKGAANLMRAKPLYYRDFAITPLR